MMAAPDMIARTVLLSLALAGGAGAAPLTATEIFSSPDGHVEANIPDSHPSTALLYASRLFDAGRKDEAVTWYYVGQLRYRFFLMANPGVSRDTDPAAFATLDTAIGNRITGWAGGSPRDWVRAIDKALAWDASHPDNVTSRERHGDKWRQVRGGLERLRAEIDQNEAQIRAKRARSGAENR